MADIATIETSVRDLLFKRLKRHGYDRAVIRFGQDHSGDDALFIDAYYNLMREPIQTRDLTFILNELRSELLSLGEQRFPYLRHHFDSKQTVESNRPSKAISKR